MTDEFKASIITRLEAIQAEAEHIKRMIREDSKAGWNCGHCGTFRPLDWFTYRVRSFESVPWTEPACAICARSMLSEGPFTTFEKSPHFKP